MPQKRKRPASPGRPERRRSSRSRSVRPLSAGDGILSSNTDRGRQLRAALTVLIAAAVVFLIVAALWTLASILLLFFAGILLAALLSFFSSRFRKLTGLSHRLSLGIVMVIIIAVVVLTGRILIPRAVQEFQLLTGKLEESLGSVELWIKASGTGRFLAERFENFRDEITRGNGIATRIAGIFSSTLGALGSFFVILFVAVYLASDPHLYERGFISLFPARSRPRLSMVLSELGSTIRWWLVSLLISMLVLGISNWLMLVLLGIPLPLILALIVAFSALVPYLGPWLALIPILLVAFLQSPAKVIWAFLLFEVIQIIEGNIITPIVYKKTVKIPPALTIMSQIVFGTLFGFMGIVLAAPLMAIIIQSVRMLYVEDVLGGGVGEPDGSRGRRKSGEGRSA